MNLPNKITIFRVILVPVFLAFMLIPGIPGGKWIAFAVFIIASLSDTLDGYIARKYNMVTNFGKLMDPLADKLLVCSALICFITSRNLSCVVVVIIIAREFTISAIRLVAAESGTVIAASVWGKLKTIFQMIMCCFMIADLPYSWFHAVTQVLVYIAAALTVISLIDYIVKNRKVFSDHSGEKDDK